MSAMLDTLTEREQKLARGMAAAIWGIDLDATLQIPTERAGVTFPVLAQLQHTVAWFAENQLRAVPEPAFSAETIILDRWLVPWKLKAGYSERINTLAYRLEVA